jgi:hypothetical protein
MEMSDRDRLFVTHVMYHKSPKVMVMVMVMVMGMVMVMVMVIWSFGHF